MAVEVLENPGVGAGTRVSTPKTYINIKDVTVRYRPDLPTAVENLNIEVRQGEFMCIVGPSGCGKSTLLNVLSGLLRPTTGEVLIGGKELYTEQKRHSTQIGYVFQDHRLLPWRTVRQNLEITLQAAKVPKEEQWPRIQRYLKLVQIEEFANTWPLRLSGGQRQRVALVRALVIEPAFIIMDEPLSTLDEVTSRTMRTEILDIWAKTGKTVIFVTHSVREAVYLADRIVVLTKSPGRLLDILDIDVPRPRNPESMRIAEIEAEMMQLVTTHWGIESVDCAE